MKRLWRRILRNAIGVACLGIGILGGFVPILPGFVFVLAGLLLIDWPGRRRLHAALRHTKAFHSAEDWLHRRFGLRFDDETPDEPKNAAPSEPPQANDRTPPEKQK